MKISPIWMCLGVVLTFSACKKHVAFQSRDNTAEMAAFRERINEEIRDELDAGLKRLTAELEGEMEESERAEKEGLLADLKARMERPDYFETKDVSELPTDLEWETGMDEPDIGSPDAKKGGTFHTHIPGGAYPPTIRSCGKEANNSFRSFHWDNIEMGLVGLHPNTGRLIPGLADRWAVGEDGRSVYFHIDDEATWSDGREVTSQDFVMTFTAYLSPYLDQSFYKIYYKDQFWGISTYGKDYLCIRIAYPKPLAPFAATVAPFQTEFYKEFGPDFIKRYNWRPRPTTGAYMVRKEDIDKGRSIALTRVKDWWAKDRKYYRNRFNVDRIEYRQVRDEEKVFQMFLRGDIDLYWLNDAKKWYERTEVDAVFSGYIERAVFYNDYPRVSRGLYMNFSKPPLDNLDVRIGLNHATNWEKVIELDLRGDAERLHLLNEGFGDISNPNIRAREFSIPKARAAFARAGFDKMGDDGILMNDKGRRLSFTVNHVKHPTLDPMLLRLKEEAQQAGVEYKLEGMDATASFQKTSKKEHEIALAGWGITPPFPDFYQQFHSKEAYLPGTRKPRPATNNISVFADPEVDPILEANRNARSLEVVKDTSWKLEQIFHDRAVWIPAYKRPFYRLGYWRWMRWPDDFNVRIADEPEMSHVFWIDQEIKAETLEAMRTGETFEEQYRVYDQYRTGMSSSSSETPEAEEAGEAGEESGSADGTPGDVEGGGSSETVPADEAAVSGEQDTESTGNDAVEGGQR
ncbi:ABC transporter substrate-binding protein [Haloferula rosea]|uniref:Solute-binding protein family 5 domain-containing protein n=1 Tax=Haloferula rosea TaxID=490093 RepID=A0A934RH08_9BACT|nr:ABC transporter substrate-binding protein [Haloferula rosea]MBK1828381.1 hypothetical protein [Haloferula rosea]